MAMTWDREGVTTLYSGADRTTGSTQDGLYTDPVSGRLVDRWGGREDTPAGLLLNLRGTGRDSDPASVLAPLLRDLNERHDSRWDEEAEQDGWGDGWIEVSVPGVEAIALQNRHDFLTPTHYLDELCRVLTDRGWSGHITVPPLMLSHVGGPPGSEASIASVLDLGMVEVRSPVGRRQSGRRFRSPWQDERALAEHVADVALEWLSGADGPLVVDWVMTWEATADQARRHVADQLVAGSLPTLERLRVGERPADGTSRAIRTGRVVRLGHGSISLIEHEPGVPLLERLQRHKDAVAEQEPWIRAAFTSASTGLRSATPRSLLRGRSDLTPGAEVLREADVGAYQLSGHTTGLLDVHYAQVFPASWLSKAADLGAWDVELGAHGLVDVRASEPTPWFERRTARRTPGDRAFPVQDAEDAPADVLARARADFGDILQRALVVAEPPAHPHG